MWKYFVNYYNIKTIEFNLHEVLLTASIIAFDVFKNIVVKKKMFNQITNII